MQKLSKKQRTRAALIESAIQVIAHKGIANTTVNDITDQAGMANGTYYNHFNNKEEIVSAAAVALAGAMGAAFDAAMQDIKDAGVRVATATGQAINSAVANPTWGQALVDFLRHQPELRSQVIRYLRQDLALGHSQGVFSEAVTPYLLDALCAVIGEAIMYQITHGPDQQVTEAACGYVLRLAGVTPARAKRFIEKAYGPLQQIAIQ